MSERVDCPMCDGSGEYECPGCYILHECGECGECGGTGKVASDE